MPARCISPVAFIARTAASAGQKFICSMRPRSNASARARHTAPMSLGPRSAAPPRSTDARAASSSPTSPHCPAAFVTATPWARSYRRSKPRSAAASPASSPIAGYRGHNAPNGYRLKVYTSGQKRNVTQAIKRDLRRRSVVEPVMVTSRRSIAWIATISPTGPGMPSTPSSLSHPATARPGLHPELESRMPPPFTLYQTVSKTDRPLRTIVLVEAAVDFAGET